MNVTTRWSLTGLLAGVLFGLGLSVSQMTNPAKVLGFLNLPGNWDASLLFTMGAAVLVASIGFRYVLRSGPVFGDTLHLPTRKEIDPRLVAGAIIFGIGWGLAGYCPGPAITGLASGAAAPFYFVAAMLVGSQLGRLPALLAANRETN